MDIKAFITQLDKQALRAIGVTVLMFVIVVGMILIGRKYFNLNEEGVQDFLGAVSDSAWALPATIVLFVLAAFIGAPQWLLIGAAVVAFGPTHGFIYSWIATMVSASGNFWLGRAVGAERVKRYGGKLVNRMIRLVKRNGFVTSFTVRLVPTGPFVLVNMAAGVSRMTFPAFFGGTAFGILPKIAAIAFLGQSLVGALQGNLWVFGAGLFAFIGLILGVMLFARSRLAKRERVPEDESKESEL